MAFDVSASDYDRFMGRYSVPLARAFAAWADLPETGEVLDVGSGPGALTSELVDRYGAEWVTAVDPSASFVAAIESRLPGAEARLASAEALPFPDDSFDATLAQLVVHFMTDASAGVAEMVRVTRTGGVVAACVWDVENSRAPHAVFVRVAHEVSGAPVPPLQPGTRDGDLVSLLENAGCRDVEQTELTVESDYAGFDEWWDVHSLGVGTAASALRGLDDDDVAEVRRRTREILGEGALSVSGTAWAARGIVP